MLKTAIDDMLERAQRAATSGNAALRAEFDALPAAIYFTDVDGVITYFNPPCVEFAGRRPQVGQDRWCITWRLYTDAGEFLPHDECPMAVAINTQRPVRDVSGVAERPDGARLAFRAYPTPIFDAAGAFAGAVNLLEDVTDEVRAEDLLAQARRCRRLAKDVNDRHAAETLSRMADEYEEKAAELRPARPSA
jgi:PAS domain S-box-containing protein